MQSCNATQSKLGGQSPTSVPELLHAFLGRNMHSKPLLAVDVVEHRSLDSNIRVFIMPPCSFRLDGHKSVPLWVGKETTLSRNIANHLSMWFRVKSHRMQAGRSQGEWLFVPELFCLRDDESWPTSWLQWSSSHVERNQESFNVCGELLHSFSVSASSLVSERDLPNPPIAIKVPQYVCWDSAIVITWAQSITAYPYDPNSWSVSQSHSTTCCAATCHWSRWKQMSGLSHDCTSNEHRASYLGLSSRPLNPRI